jgi:elongation factor Ts
MAEIAITAADVNKLRQMTGAGMMDCKKALTEAGGDFDAAVDNLRKKGQKVSASRADRDTTEGAVFITTDGKNATLLALGCETDFVGKNEDFRSLGNKILAVAVAAGATTPEAVLATELEGRPAGDSLTDLMGKIGEKMEIVSYGSVSGDQTATYVHSNGKIGVIVAFTGGDGADLTEVGKDVALQIASMKPVAVDKEGVDPSLVEREIEIGKEQARNEGKPEAMIEKIALGKLNKFYQDNTLLNQSFVKDGSLTIRQLLEKTAKGLTVAAFKRVAIGG